MKPSISIIVPVYNIEAYIEQCLVSLIAQTEKNIEIICVDDGSSDNSKEILMKYKSSDDRVKLIFQDHKGTGAARNIGINNSLAEYIMFCDGDDWYEPNMCEMMLSVIRTKNVDFAMCDCNLVVEKIIRNDGDYPRLKIFGLHSLTSENRLHINVVLWNKIFKRSIIEENRILFPEISIGEDLSFVHQYICVAKRFYGLDETLYNHRHRDSSLMSVLYKEKQKEKIESFCYQNVDAYLYTFNALKSSNRLDDNINFLLKSFFYQLKWLMKKDQTIKTDLLEYTNKVFLFELDLENYAGKIDDAFLIETFQKIKSKQYDFFVMNNNIKSKRKSFWKKIILASKLIKTYFLFPVYIYKIYKILSRNNKKYI